MKKILLVFIIYCASALFFAPLIFAASLTLQNGTVSLASFNDEFSVDANISISAADNTAYYLRGVFYKAGSSNYCGQTWNGNSWFAGPYSSGDGWKNFLRVTVADNSWSGQLKAKLDPNDSGCQGTGAYNFKIERFTESGSGTYDTQNELSLNVVLPTPTFTPTPSPKPTLTPKPTPTDKPTPTQKAVPTLKPASTSSTKSTTSSSSNSTFSTPAVLASDDSDLNDSNEASMPSVLSASISSVLSATKTPVRKVEIASAKSARSPFGPIMLIIGALVILSACGILGYRKWKRIRNQEL